MKYLLIDMSSLVVPYSHTCKDISGFEHVTEYVFRKIIKIANKFETKNLIFTYEGGGESYREKLEPSYKQNRRDKKKDRSPAENEFFSAFFDLFNQMREILEGMGFNNSFAQKGTEADDLLASIPAQDEHTFHDFVIVSSDGDLLQILQNKNVIIYNQQKEKVITKADFIEEKGFEPSIYWRVKALAGDTGDGVIGIKGIGEAKSIQYFNGTLKETSKAYQSIVDFPLEKKRINGKLVKLPIPQTRDVVLREDEASLENFVKYCMANGLDSLMNAVYDDWDEFFKGSEEDIALKRRKERMEKKNGR